MGFYTVTDSQGLVRYCYVTNTGLEAPTLVVNPGDNLIIHFPNDLPAAASSTSDNMASMKMTLSNDSAMGDAATSTSPACNGSMGTNVTNIHFHGTDIAPVCGQDEVIHTLVQPGQSFDYNVTIPTTEPPGLYWYHPHPHGISEGQVQGGATGALIVQGIQNVFPSLANMPTRTLVIRDQTLPASEANDNNIPAWDLSINYVPVTYPSYTPAVIADPSGRTGAVARREHGRRHHPQSSIRRQRHSTADAGVCDRRLSALVGKRQQHDHAFRWGPARVRSLW